MYEWAREDITFFFAWPIIGIWFAFSFEAQKTVLLKIAVLSTFILVSFFEIAGWWRLALVYSGILEKVGTINTGIGFLSPTIGNVALVLDRLRALAFPQGAVILYAIAFGLRSVLSVWTIFFLQFSPRDAQPGHKLTEPARKDRGALPAH